MIQFLTRLPNDRLAPYIRMYFWAKDDNPPLVQRIVPNGEMGLCFYRSNSVTYLGLGERQSCLSGQFVHYQDIVSNGGIEIVGAHFTTLGAHLFFRMPLRELFGKTLSLSDVNDEGLVALEEKIMAASDCQGCWDLLDAFFLKRIVESAEDSLNIRRLQRAIAYGQRHLSDAHICDVASEACLSERHFSRLFADMVGLSPKDYLRLQRYHQTLHDLKNANRTAQESFTEIAWGNGYYDFSHLSSDFRKISGYSPTQLLKESANDDDLVGWRL
ncbi:MAG: helix-turn-helix domain-containing protein [Paludibacteraceae bacterium]|nr:helix-turn-helix domain-containing protein [Paludibacteraceae bacterium]